MRFKEALFYNKIAEKKVHCVLCPHSCIIGNGEAGKCDARQNINGKLKSLVYGKPYMASYQPVEQNSLYHFLPKSESLNVATAGNTLKGKFYGKYLDVGQTPNLNLTPLQIIKQMQKTSHNIITYSGEPTIFYEYIKDIAEKSKEFKHIISSNGFIEPEAIKQMSEFVNGGIFEIRAMNDGFYETICDGKLEPVLKAIKKFYDEGKWTEIKMAMISGMHDSLYDVRKLVAWILNELNENIPLHFIQFKTDENTADYLSTDSELLKHARKIAIDAGMNYVYTDTLDWDEGRTTFCPNCKKPLIIRRKNETEIVMKKGRCKCGTEIAGVWQ